MCVACGVCMACVWRVAFRVWGVGCGVWGVVGGRVGYAKAWPRRGGERREAPQLSAVAAVERCVTR